MFKLLPKLMRLGRVGSKSDRAYEETNRQLDKITPSIELFPRSADDESSDPTPSANGSAVTSRGADTDSPPSSALLHAGVFLIEPLVSRTKGLGLENKRKMMLRLHLMAPTKHIHKGELW
jgi:hypothetical protein